jgi:hypothetical protein
MLSRSSISHLMNYVYPSNAFSGSAAVAQRVKQPAVKKAVRFNACVLRVELIPENRVGHGDTEQSEFKPRNMIDYPLASHDAQDDTSLEAIPDSSKWPYQVLPPMRLSPSASVGEQTEFDDPIVFVPPTNMKNLSEKDLLPYVKINTKVPNHAAIRKAKSALKLCAIPPQKPEPLLEEIKTTSRTVRRRRVISTPSAPRVSETVVEIAVEQRVVRRSKAKFLVREEDESESEGN